MAAAAGRAAWQTYYRAVLDSALGAPVRRFRNGPTAIAGKGRSCISQRSATRRTRPTRTSSRSNLTRRRARCCRIVPFALPKGAPDAPPRTPRTKARFRSRDQHFSFEFTALSSTLIPTAVRRLPRRQQRPAFRSRIVSRSRFQSPIWTIARRRRYSRATPTRFFSRLPGREFTRAPPMIICRAV